MIKNIQNKHDELIMETYHTLLCRDPDPEGFRYWREKLNAGMSRDEFLHIVSTSDEYRQNKQTQTAQSRFEPMKILKTYPELDAELEKAEKASQVSDDAMRAVLDKFTFQPPESFFSKCSRLIYSDPYSDEYRKNQMNIYSKISGMEYNPASSEQSVFDVQTAVKTPFPYATRSPQTVGCLYVNIGNIIKALPISPPAKILEFGPGWGNLTIALARTGIFGYCDRYRAALRGANSTQSFRFWNSTNSGNSGKFH